MPGRARQSVCAAADLLVGAHREVQEIRSVAARRRFSVGRLRKSFARKRTDGVEHPIAAACAAGVAGTGIRIVGTVEIDDRNHQRLVDEPRQQLEHGTCPQRCMFADGFRAFELEAAREDRQPFEQRPLTHAQKLIGPVHERGQRLMPRQCIARSGRKQTKPVAQSARHFLDG